MIGRVLASAAAFAAIAGPAAAQFPASWSAPTAPFRIADNLYYVGTAGLSSFLITTPQGHILIDGGMPGNPTPIEASIRALGFKPADVKILLNSHAHFDHAGGLAQLKADTGAKLFAMAQDREALETGTYPGSEEVELFKFPPAKVDRVLQDGETVRLGGVALTALLTPGHTEGCTSWALPVTIDGVRRQALINCSLSVAANRLVHKEKGPQYPGIVADYRKAFARLKAVRADVFLAMHAEQFGLDGKRARLGAGANPFVDPAELPAAVARAEADFEAQLARQEEAAR